MELDVIYTKIDQIAFWWRQMKWLISSQQPSNFTCLDVYISFGSYPRI